MTAKWRSGQAGRRAIGIDEPWSDVEAMCGGGAALAERANGVRVCDRLRRYSCIMRFV